MGFYPVCPGSGEYVLGTPYFDRITLHLTNGCLLTITAHNISHDNRYIGTMEINGQSYDRNFLSHSSLIKGGTINYQMQSNPNYQRGITAEAAPYSFSKTIKK